MDEETINAYASDEDLEIAKTASAILTVLKNKYKPSIEDEILIKLEDVDSNRSYIVLVMEVESE